MTHVVLKRIKRIARIEILLLSNTANTANQLIRKLRVSKSELKEILRDMRRLGSPLIYNRTAKRYQLTEDKRVFIGWK